MNWFRLRWEMSWVELLSWGAAISWFRFNLSCWDELSWVRLSSRVVDTSWVELDWVELLSRIGLMYIKLRRVGYRWFLLRWLTGVELNRVELSWVTVSCVVLHAVEFSYLSNSTPEHTTGASGRAAQGWAAGRGGAGQAEMPMGWFDQKNWLSCFPGHCKQQHWSSLRNHVQRKCYVNR